MLRGMITFKCTTCGNKFVAPDIEYAATVYTMPQKCPQCGSIRTRPAGLLGRMKQGVYERIWEEMERK